MLRTIPQRIYSSMKSIIIIPARLESKRLNRKLLLPGPKGTNDLPLLYFTWSQAKDSSADEVYIATDSSEIVQEATKFGAIVIMTKKAHNCGTNRIEEAYAWIKDTTTRLHKDLWIEADCIINLQGDEPEIRGEDIDLLIKKFQEWYDDDEYHLDLPAWMKMATLAAPFYNFTQYSLPQNVKVVFDEDDNEAIYFSRGMIPWINPINHQLQDWQTGKGKPIAYKHIGIYAYTPQMLTEFVQTKASRLEKIEGLEQMRAIENQWPILVVPVAPLEDDKDNIWPLGVNTRHDYDVWLSRTGIR